MCTSFGDPSVNLCDALVSVACCLLTTTVDSTMPFVAFKPIPLDKHPGFYPTKLEMFLVELMPRPSFSLLVVMLYHPCTELNSGK